MIDERLLFVQLIQFHSELRFYRSGFFRLEMPFFALSEPSPAERHKVSKVQMRNSTW